MVFREGFYAVGRWIIFENKSMLTPMQKLPVTVLFLVFVLFATPLFSQDPLSPDSLLKEAAASKTDTGKARLLLKAAINYFEQGQQEKVPVLAAEINGLLRKTDNPKIQTDLYKLLGNYYALSGKRELEHSYADSMIAYSRQKGYKPGEAKGLYVKAVAFLRSREPEKAMDYLKPAANLFKELGDEFWLAQTYKTIGNSLLEFRKAKEAIPNYKIAVEKYLALGAKMDAGLTYSNMVRAFSVEAMWDSSIYYNNKAAELAKQLPVEGELHFMVAMSGAELQAKKDNYVAAEALADEAVRLANKLNDARMQGAALYIRAGMAYTAKNYTTALKYFLLAKELHENAGNFNQWLDLQKDIANTYEEMGDFKNAYAYQQTYYNVNDSLFSENSAKQINELNVQLQTAEKEKQISEQQLLLAKKNNRLWLLGIGLAAAALAILLLFFLYAQRKKTHEQTLLTLKREQDLSLLKALMTGEEKERNRLARELHDGLGGILAAAQMQVSQLEVPQQTDKEKAAGLIQQAASETRRIAHNLLPETLLRYGLNEALKEYCRSISESKLMQLDYESVGMEERLAQTTELSIYRIIQELINNSIKHAGATETFIQLHRHNHMLTITVEDNGKGFSPKETGNGIGLSNIQSRVSFLNGKMDIRSEQQKGTSVYIEILLNKHEQAA